MIAALNTSLLREKAIDAAPIGGIMYWMGIPHQVCITEDGRKIAYPRIMVQETKAA